MRAVALAFTILAAVGVTAAVQSPSADEKAIRDLIAKRNAGELTLNDATTDVAWWSGAMVKPTVGAETPQFRPGSSAGGNGRTNTTSRDQVVQLHVAASGDLAYEYSTFHSSWVRKDDQRKIEIDGAVLRTWRKVGGQWKIAAEFRRPYDDTPTEK
jgi:ketosteroid isomerase-like protein